jgi:hypothetical protein
VALVHWPNPALVVWFATAVAGWTRLLASDLSADVRLLGQGALIVWSLDELVRGASPARRALGVVVLVWLLVRIFG